MKEILKELKKELLNKKMTLLYLDNTAKKIIKTENSLFDRDIEKDIYDFTKHGSFAYYLDNIHCIIIEFYKLSDDENIKNAEIRVDEIWNN